MKKISKRFFEKKASTDAIDAEVLFHDILSGSESDAEIADKMKNIPQEILSEVLNEPGNFDESEKLKIQEFYQKNIQPAEVESAAKETEKVLSSQKLKEGVSKGIEYIKSLHPSLKLGLLVSLAAIGSVAAISALSEDKVKEYSESGQKQIRDLVNPIFTNNSMFSSVSEKDRSYMTTVLTKFVEAGKVEYLEPEQILGILHGLSSGPRLDSLDYMKSNADLMADVELLSSNLKEKATKILELRSETKKQIGEDLIGSQQPISKIDKPTEPAQSERYERPEAMSESCISDSSKILVQKGYLEKEQIMWTPDFDKAFRAFIDDATASLEQMPHTNLRGGASWVETAPMLDMEPNQTGACMAVANFSNIMPDKKFTPETKQETVTPQADVLPIIISAMYNSKLVGTPGLNLINEVKMIKCLVNAVGGPTTAGFSNAAKVLMQRNQSIKSKLPKQKEIVVDKSFAFANKDLMQTIQVTANGIYSAALEGKKKLGIFNPNIEESTKAIKEWLSTPEGGNFRFASNVNEKYIKNAYDRKKQILKSVAKELSQIDIFNLKNK